MGAIAAGLAWRAGRGRAASRARPARARPSRGAWTRHPSAAPVVVARGLWLARRDARGCPARGPGGAVARPAAGLARRRVARGCPVPGSRPRRRGLGGARVRPRRAAPDGLAGQEHGRRGPARDAIPVADHGGTARLQHPWHECDLLGWLCRGRLDAWPQVAAASVATARSLCSDVATVFIPSGGRFAGIARTSSGRRRFMPLIFRMAAVRSACSCFRVCSCS